MHGDFCAAVATLHHVSSMPLVRRCCTRCFVGFLGSQDQQKTVYGILAVIWGTIAAAKLFATRQFFDYVFGHAITNPHVGFLGLQRLAGFSTLAPAVAAYTLAVNLFCTIWRHILFAVVDHVPMLERSPKFGPAWPWLWHRQCLPQHPIPSCIWHCSRTSLTVAYCTRIESSVLLIAASCPKGAVPDQYAAP